VIVQLPDRIHQRDSSRDIRASHENSRRPRRGHTALSPTNARSGHTLNIPELIDRGRKSLGERGAVAVPIDARDAPRGSIVVRAHWRVGLRALVRCREGGAGSPRFRNVQGSVRPEDETRADTRGRWRTLRRWAVRARFRDEAASVGEVPGSHPLATKAAARGISEKMR
jgi:hypothetical protein